MDMTIFVLAIHLNVMYPHAQGYENFVQQLLAYFPNEKKALEAYTPHDAIYLR